MPTPWWVDEEQQDPWRPNPVSVEPQPDPYAPPPVPQQPKLSGFQKFTRAMSYARPRSVFGAMGAGIRYDEEQAQQNYMNELAAWRARNQQADDVRQQKLQEAQIANYQRLANPQPDPNAHGQWIETMEGGKRVKKWVTPGMGQVEMAPPIDTSQSEYEIWQAQNPTKTLDDFWIAKEKAQAAFRQPPQPPSSQLVVLGDKTYAFNPKTNTMTPVETPGGALPSRVGTNTGKVPEDDDRKDIENFEDKQVAEALKDDGKIDDKERAKIQGAVTEYKANKGRRKMANKRAGGQQAQQPAPQKTYAPGSDPGGLF
jgi:hypothetical protein